MLIALGAVGAWESLWWAVRRRRRTSLYELAQRRAAELGRPLLVIGSPDGGVTGGYGCGDMTVDLNPSAVCPNHIVADVCENIPLGDDSCVVFVSCVLEYVSDLDRAMSEIDRVSGGERFIAHVEPWTITAYAYPGAARTLPRELLDQPPLPSIQAVLRGSSGFIPLRLQVANSPESRTRGLSWRYAVPPNTGMLFVFPEPGDHPMWMRGMIVPIDIVFLDQQLRVIDIVHSAQPGSDEVYSAPGTAYVLELCAGASSRIGLTAGDRLLQKQKSE